MNRIFFACLLLFSQLSAALTPEEVVRSSMAHYPKVTEAIFEFQQAEGQAANARGEFDAKIKTSVDDRMDGFYDGKLFKGQIEKPIPYMNGNVYTGYRRSRGLFPSYEGKNDTQDRGESFLGLSLSLLRNSLIDQRRYNIRISQENVNQAQLQIEQMRIDVQTLALKAYWVWVMKGYEVKAYESILELANARNQQLKKRIKLGDLARIYESENLQYIRKREALLAKSRLEYEQAQQYLSLFYRDDEGRPKVPKTDRLPELNSQVGKITEFASDLKLALSRNVELKVLESQKRQAEVQVRLGRNDMLPDLNLNYEWSKDHGVGSSTLADNENRVMVNLNIPLEYNKGRGKRKEGQAKLNVVKTKAQLAKERVKVFLQNLYTKINYSAEIIGITKQQIELANKLVKAENKKFRQGASDLILLNIREENLVEAQIANYEERLRYHFYRADLYQQKFEFLP